jgi:Kef-type K+ transport system membrane component KefB
MDNILTEVLHMLQLSFEKTPPIMLLGVIVLAGALCGELARRFALPRLTGYLAAGVATHLALAALDLGWPIQELVQDFLPLFEVALGFALVEVGRRIQLHWLARNKALLATVVLESVLSFAAVSLALFWLGVGPWTAVLLGAIVTGTSPLVLQAVSLQVRAEGQISERALHIAAVNTMTAAVLVSALLPVANAAQPHLELVYIFKPLAGLVLAAVIGSLCGRLLRLLLNRSRDLPYAWTCVVGIVSLLVGASQWMAAPVVVAALAMGLSVSEAAQRRVTARKLNGAAAAGVAAPAPAGPAPLLWPEPPALSVMVYVVLFLFAGAALPWHDWWSKPQDWPFVAGVAAALLLVRFAAKAAAVLATGSWSGLRPAQSVGLAAALQPLSVTALALYLQVRAGYAGLEPAAAGALLVALAAADLLMPVVTMITLRASGEAETAPPQPTAKPAAAAEGAAPRLREQ